jgi:hypothetical protein
VLAAVLVTSIAAHRLDGSDAGGTAPASRPSVAATARATTSAAERRAACLGAAARAGGAGCSDVDLGSTVYPGSTAISSDNALQYDCFTPTYGKLMSCRYGSSETGALRVAFVGDNRAASLLPGVLPELPEAGWTLTTFIGDGCVLSVTPVDRCSGAQKAIIDAVTRKGAYDLVITAADRADGLTSASFTSVFARVRAAGAKLVVVRDTPRPSTGALACSARPDVDPEKQTCGTARAEALIGTDPLVQAASDAGASLIDLTRYFCTATRCPAVIGNVVVFRDAGADLTTTFSRTVGPYVMRDVQRKLKP